MEVNFDDDDDDPEGLCLFRKTSRGFVPIVKSDADDEGGKKKQQKSALKRPTEKEEEVVTVGEREMRLPAAAFASGKEGKVGLVNKGIYTSYNFEIWSIYICGVEYLLTALDRIELPLIPLLPYGSLWDFVLNCVVVVETRP